MAGIEEYLDKIKHAVYGREVRQAIHDGIETCYKEGKAGSTDLEARQRLDSVEPDVSSLKSRMSTAESDIDVLDSRVDQIVAPSGKAPSAAEVTDARVGADGVTYTSLGSANRTQFANVNSLISQSGVYTWERGTVNDDTGADVASTSRIRSQYIYLLKGTVLSISPNFKHVVMGYNDDFSKRIYIQDSWTSDDIVVDETGYIRIVMRKNNNTEISVGEISVVASNEYIKSPDIQATLEHIVGVNSKKGLVPIWNEGVGGIYIDGVSIKMKQNGFGIVMNGKNYYIASTDHQTEYTFSKPSGNDNYPFFLVLDTSKVTTIDGRTEPSVALSVVDIYSFIENYKNDYVIVAQLYPSYWEFVSPFVYFNQFGSAKSQHSFAPISDIFAQNNLVAHMGGDADEANTIRNFEVAISNGYKILECDVQFTSDNIAVLSHEDTISFGGQTYTIANERYSTLLAIKPNLATLEEFLILCKTKNVAGEIDFTKTYTASQQELLNQLIVQTGMINRVIVTAYAPVCRTLLAINSDLLVCVSGVNSTSNVDDIVDIINAARLCICSTLYSNATKPLVNYMHSKKALSKPWTVNTLATVKDLFEMGCDFIITDSVKPSDL